MEFPPRKMTGPEMRECDIGEMADKEKTYGLRINDWATAGGTAYSGTAVVASTIVL